MAYGIKYKFDYRSPMREKLTYQVSISERDYEGEVMYLKPIGEDFKITQGQIDDNELVPTKASELSMTILCTEEGDPLTELFTVDPTQYLVFVGVCRTTAEGNEVCMTLWSGYISTGGYSQPYAKPPYRVTIHANDGLAILQTMPYLTPEGNMHTGVKSIAQHIKDIMSQIAVRPARVWSAYHLSVAQKVDTFDAIGLSAEAIYAKFGEETPTYYDVLVSILNNFGLQLFQSYGTWIARPLSALLASRRPEWYNDVAESFGMSNDDRTLPLFGTAENGYGMSTSAVMTLHAPLKQVTTMTPDPSFIVKPLGAKDPKQWYDNMAWARPKVRGSEGVILQVPGSSSGMGKLPGMAHTFDGTLRYSPNTTIDFKFRYFDRDRNSKTFSYAICLIPQSWGNDWVKDRWVDIFGGADDQHGYFWDSGNNEWSHIRHTYTVDIEGRRRAFGYRAIPKEEMDELSTEVAVSIVGIPYDGMRLALVFSDCQLFEVYDVTLEIHQEGITIAEVNSPYVVSPFGVDSLEIAQDYVVEHALPLSAAAFQPTIVTIDSGEPLPGMLSPSESTTIASAIASSIEAMRGGVTRTLEGEVYMPSPIDLNTLWRDRDGRAYYTNYIVTNAKRGVYGVQLCELLPLARLEQDALAVPLPGEFMTNIVGIGNAVFYTTLTSPGLYLTDVNSGKSKLVHEKNAPYFYVRKGYRCVCAIDYIQEGDAAQIACSAYNAGGELLSSAVLDSALIQNSELTTVQGIAETLAYDTLCDVWYSAWWNGQVVRCAIWDTSGAQLYMATVTSLASRPTAIKLVPVNNGFVVAHSTEHGTFANFHNNAIHEGASVGGAMIIGEIKAIADKYIVLQSNDYIVVKPRNELEVVAPLADVVASFPASEYEYLCHNQVLVALRHIRTRAIKVLDVRTLREVNIDSELFTGSVWLNGEWLRTMVNGKFYRQRIGDGDGNEYDYLYDSSVSLIYDANGEAIRVIKEE